VTAILEKDLILAPLASADRFLRAFLAAHPAPKGTGARIVLRVGEVAQPVIAALEPLRRPGEMTPHYTIHWAAENGGPYPEFDGELSVVADEDYNGFWLVLEGAYAPPGGSAGSLFDAAIGRRIAQSTTRGLLRELRVEIEALFRAQEGAKAS
jgi:hypothetical protein